MYLRVLIILILFIGRCYCSDCEILRYRSADWDRWNVSTYSHSQVQFLGFSLFVLRVTWPCCFLVAFLTSVTFFMLPGIAQVSWSCYNTWLLVAILSKKRYLYNSSLSSKGVRQYPFLKDYRAFPLIVNSTLRLLLSQCMWNFGVQLVESINLVRTVGVYGPPGI